MGLPRSAYYDVPAIPADEAEIAARIKTIREEFETYGYLGLAHQYIERLEIKPAIARVRDRCFLHRGVDRHALQARRRHRLGLQGHLDRCLQDLWDRLHGAHHSFSSENAARTSSSGVGRTGIRGLLKPISLIVRPVCFAMARVIDIRQIRPWQRPIPALVQILDP